MRILLSARKKLGSSDRHGCVDKQDEGDGGGEQMKGVGFGDAVEKRPNPFFLVGCPRKGATVGRGERFGGLTYNQKGFLGMKFQQFQGFPIEIPFVGIFRLTS